MSVPIVGNPKFCPFLGTVLLPQQTLKGIEPTFPQFPCGGEKCMMWDGHLLTCSLKDSVGSIKDATLKLSQILALITAKEIKQ